MNPKVFLSHASEDKDRFVIKFAEKLLAKGIDVWLDKWEMYPGDSLVDKIFEEGLKEAEAIIIVISNYSINKPWVREELNAGIIKKLSKGTKIIPVVIDDCQVPESLQSTLWEKINDINNYEVELDRIIKSIYGVSDKPKIGPIPTFVKANVDMIPGLTKIDNLIIKVAGDKAVELEKLNFNTDDLMDDALKLGINNEEFLETLTILHSRGYINGTVAMNGYIPFFAFSTLGFREYGERYIPNYYKGIDDVALHILNYEVGTSDDVAVNLPLPKALVRHAFHVLEQRGLIKFQTVITGNQFLHYISPELKRMFK